MSSRALVRWRGERAARLDRLRAARAAFAGSGPGRRWQTTELNHSLILRLASEFQGFARDLHDEAAEIAAGALADGDGDRRAMLEGSFTARRRLDRGNADPRGLDEDFGLVGVDLWSTLRARWPVHALRWHETLLQLNQARNGIAHDDLRKLDALGVPLTLTTFTGWRNQVDRLAIGMDDVVTGRLRNVLGIESW